MSNNAPYAVMELDKELYEFLIKNCEVNLHQMTSAIDPCGPMSGALSRGALEQLVDYIEKFKHLRAAAERGVGQ